MTVWEGLFLGLLQGLTEFLPISSSGHLVLAEKILVLPSDLFFNVMMHVGTLFAVLTVFFKPVLKMTLHPIRDKRMLLITLSSIPTFIIAFAVKTWVPEKYFNGLLPLGFFITAVLLITTSFSKNNRPLYQRPVIPALVAGIAQGIAVFPGISRSGATIASLSFFNIKRTQSADFSFLMSIPVIMGGAALEAYEAFTIGIVINWLPLAVGIIAAYISGIIAIKFLIALLKHTDLRWFSLYMVIPLLLSLLVGW